MHHISHGGSDTMYLKDTIATTDVHSTYINIKLIGSVLSVCLTVSAQKYRVGYFLIASACEVYGSNVGGG